MPMRQRSAVMRPLRSCCLLFGLASLATICRGDSLTTQVSCSTPTQGTSGSTSCTVNDLAGNAATETIAATATYPSSPSGYFVFTISDTGDAESSYGNYGPNVEASSSVNMAFVLRTVGPERPGYIEIIPPDPTSEYSTIDLSYSIGDLQASCAGYEPNGGCFVSATPANGPGQNPKIYDFTLGVPFDFTVNYSDVLNAPYEDGLADVDTASTLQFRFLEADGTTPVALNPEPSTWALVCGGVVLGLLVRWSRMRLRGDSETYCGRSSVNRRGGELR